ncbi:MAG: S-layer homology domain-containing protein [Clostridiales bacterium]|nr:S-layer homology domain-containing protein [Clostridiales bacterium]
MKKGLIKRISGLLAAAVFMTAALNPVFAEDAAASYIEEAEVLGLFNSVSSEDLSEGFTVKEFKAAAADLLDKWNGSHSEEEIVKIFNVPEITGSAVLTREQAAKLLYNTLDIGSTVISEAEADNEYGVNGIFMPRIFADGIEIDSFARREIYTMYNLGIMTADSKNNFDPLETFTKDEAIQSFLNLYKTKESPDEVETPTPEAFPAVSNALKYVESEDRYILQADYVWYEDDYSYEPVYYDGFGGVHQASEEGYGYVYPLDRNYMEVLVSSGVGVAASIIIDKDKNDVSGQVYQVLSLTNKDAYVWALYTYKTEHLVFDDSEDEEEAEEETKQAEETETLEYHLEDISDGNESEYAVVDNTGNTIKTYSLDTERYSVTDTYGTNIILFDREECKRVLYRAYSETTVDLGDIDYISFTSKGYIIAFVNGSYSLQDENTYGYFLDPSGNVIYDFRKMGYTKILGTYNKDKYIRLVKKDENGNELYDIMTPDGEITELNASKMSAVVTSKDGISAITINGNQVLFFDAKGDKLGTISLDEEINSSVRFVSGLFSISTNDKNKYYYTPYGEPAVKKAWTIKE